MIKKALGNTHTSDTYIRIHGPLNVKIQFSLSVSGMYQTLLRITAIQTQLTERLLRDSQLYLCAYWLFKKCE